MALRAVQGSDLDIYAKQVQRQLSSSNSTLHGHTPALSFQDTDLTSSWCSGAFLRIVSIMWVRHCYSHIVHPWNLCTGVHVSAESSCVQGTLQTCSARCSLTPSCFLRA